MTAITDVPIFDADTHMYETPEALIKFLPEKYKSAVQFVQMGHQVRISILDQIRDYIPNPTFDRVAAPGAWEAFFSGNNEQGKSLREMAKANTIKSQPASSEVRTN